MLDTEYDAKRSASACWRLTLTWTSQQTILLKRCSCTLGLVNEVVLSIKIERCTASVTL